MKALTLEGRAIAGFWTRIAAFTVDLLLWSVVSTALGLSLVALAPRSFGLSSALLDTRVCEPLGPIPKGLARHVPAGFTVSEALRCTSSIAGFPFRTELVLEDVRDEGDLTVTRRLVFQTDKDLKPVHVRDLDTALFAGFFVYLVVAQGRTRRTIGKWLFRLRVIDQGGRAPGLKAAVIRNAILFAPTGMATLAVYGAMSAGWLFAWPVAMIVGVSLGLGLSLLALGAQIWWTASHGLPSIHDSFAKTLVVRLPA